MSDLVLGRLVRAVERALDDSAEPSTTSPHQWVSIERLDHALEPLRDDAAGAEAIGRDLIDEDVRTGPYRFLLPELSVASLDELAPAIFRGYFTSPGVEVRVTRDSLRFHWTDPPAHPPARWALIDGMAKRIAELAQLEVKGWSTATLDGARTLRGPL